MSLSEETKDQINHDLFYVAQHIVSGRLAAYLADIKAVKPCVVNPSTIDDIVNFFQAFQNLRPVCEAHMARWEREAEKMKRSSRN